MPLLKQAVKVVKKKNWLKEVDEMNQRIHHLHHPTVYDQTVKEKKLTEQATKNFQQILAKKQSINVSKHAKERMIERNIHFSEHQWSELNSKLNEAKQKGVRESVVVLNNATLLANAQKNTVITVLNTEEANSKIFTNINGAIILQD